MLTESHKSEIRTRFAAISAAMPNFHPRPAQRAMIAEVAKALGKCPDPGMILSDIIDKHYGQRVTPKKWIRPYGRGKKESEKS